MMPSFWPAMLDFLPRFLAGMAVNFEIAGLALGLGLACGGVLALARLPGGAAGAAAAAIIGLMRAAPTFVVMFFLLNAAPFSADLTGVMIVALSLVPYAAAYVADSGVEAMRHWRGGSPLASVLFFPNMARAFFVLVMSSGTAAAIGVTEGITVLLHQAEQLPSLGDQLLLFALGVACFGVPLQAAFAVIRVVQRHLGRIVVRNSIGTVAGAG